jgi:hypothetical protein
VSVGECCLAQANRESEAAKQAEPLNK